MKYLTLIVILVLLSCQKLDNPYDPQNSINPPGNFTASKSGNLIIKLSWSISSSVKSGYIIERRLTSDPIFDEHIEVPATDSTYFDNLFQWADYTYRIKGYSDENETDWVYTDYVMSFDITIDPTGNGDFFTIQDGINNSIDGDIILITNGIYVENINLQGKNISLVSEFFTTQNEEDIEQTIIDGGSNGCVIIIDSGEISCLLLGFTVKNGFAEYGAGIFCEGVGVMIDNVVIKECEATYYGGGIYGNNSNIYIRKSSVNQNNSLYGGGIVCDFCDIDLKQVIISGNGAISSSLDNRAGGLYFVNSQVFLSNIIVNDNEATNGAGIYTYDSDVNIVNSILVNNNGSYGTGLYCINDSDVIIGNCIVWYNQSTEGEGHDIEFEDDPNGNFEPNHLDITYSDLEITQEDIIGNGTVEIFLNNIITPPYFINPSIDFHLQEESVCIDAGDPDPIFNDADGTRNDMGAYGGPLSEW